jgi:pimeloyl-ACP methyl ester carboxylesterase
MGAAIALTLALESAPAGLVLIGSGARLRVNPRLLEMTSRPESHGEAVEAIVGWSYAPQAPPRLLELARARLLETDPVSLHRALSACDNFDVSDRLGMITCPTLILVGEHDRMTPPRLSQELVQKIPGARLEMIEAAGHMLMLERPEQVAASLTRFLSGVG